MFFRPVPTTNWEINPSQIRKALVKFLNYKFEDSCSDPHLSILKKVRDFYLGLESDSLGKMKMQELAKILCEVSEIFAADERTDVVNCLKQLIKAFGVKPWLLLKYIPNENITENVTENKEDHQNDPFAKAFDQIYNQMNPPFKASQNLDKKKSEIHQLPSIPQIIETKDLDEHGRLIINDRKKIKDYIDDQILMGSLSGFFELESLHEEFKTPESEIQTHFVFYRVDATGNLEIYWAYSKEIAEASQADVYAVQKESDNNWYFLKQLKPKLSSDIKDIEYKASMNLRRGKPNDRFFIECWGKYSAEVIVMEYIRGKDLNALINENADAYNKKSEYKLSPSLWLDMMIQVLQEIINFHNAGFLHCDPKPENYMVVDGYVPVLIDAGLSMPLGSEEKELKAEVPMHIFYRDEYSNQDTRSKLTDMYSIGVILIIMADMYDLPSLKNHIIKLTSESSDRFNSNRIFANIETRKTCRNLLERMTGPLAKRPQSLKECKQVFVEMSQDKSFSAELKVAVIDVTKFLSEPSSTFSKVANLYPRVILVDLGNKCTPRQYLEARQFLEREGSLIDTVIRLAEGDFAKLDSFVIDSVNKSNPGKVPIPTYLNFSLPSNAEIPASAGPGPGPGPGPGRA